MYHYLSDFVVGSEKVVKYRRYLNKGLDDCLNTDKLRVIRSGSKAEGLDLHGSDLDLMCLFDFVVEENNENTKEKSMCLDTENALPGFACIKIPRGYDLENISCKNISITNTGSGLFMTNDFGKQNMSKTMSKQMSTFNDLSKQGRMSEQLRKKLEVYIAGLLVGDFWNALHSVIYVIMCDISKPLNGIPEFDKTLLTIDLPDVDYFSFVVQRSMNFFVYRIRNEHCPSPLKNIYTMALLDLCKCLATSVKMLSVDTVPKCSSNKQYYSQYKLCLFYLLLNLYRDAVAGWLLLGTFFYSCQEYDKMSEVLLLSENISTLKLYDLPCLGYVPTLKQINCKTSIQSKPFLKRLRHTFIKTPVFYKGNNDEDSFVFHKDFTHSGWRVVHFGSQEVHLRYLLFLKLYKQKHTERMDSALLLLKEAVGRIPRSNVSSAVNYSYLLKAQLLFGDDDHLTTIRKYFRF
ncbi:unnamed protein product [Mytilus edulis]|uniref:Cyclic GMP-AMP synthase n=1 Tax=Mytilus edulis TaxID=6550 RepID=A0A8S3VEL2_MYTED|nr:unnamed protein product [Mytilus edulis]